MRRGAYIRDTTVYKLHMQVFSVRVSHCKVAEVFHWHQICVCVGGGGVGGGGLGN